MIEGIIVRLVNLPCNICGFVAESPDGWQNVYINSRLTREQQLEALEHEMKHVEGNDLHAGKDLCEVEIF